MIRSGAVVQNFYGVGPTYPSSYNSMARPGNFEVSRPYDPSKAFDTGFPKDVSPYQPRVITYTTEVPRSVFKPRKYSKRLALKNGAFMGQTALKQIFGGEENEMTDYMAQRLLGLVDGRMSIEMSQDDPYRQYRDPTVASTSTTTAQSSAQSSMGSDPMGSQSSGSSRSSRPPLTIDALNLGASTTPTPANQPMQFSPVSTLPSYSTPTTSVLGDIIGRPAPSYTTEVETAYEEQGILDAVGEVETTPTAAAQQLDLLIPVEGTMVQETEVGPVQVMPARGRGFGPGDLRVSPVSPTTSYATATDVSPTVVTPAVVQPSSPSTSPLQAVPWDGEFHGFFTRYGADIERLRLTAGAEHQRALGPGGQFERNFNNRTRLNVYDNIVSMLWNEHSRQYPQDREGIRLELQRRYRMVPHNRRPRY